MHETLLNCANTQKVVHRRTRRLTPKQLNSHPVVQSDCLATPIAGIRVRLFRCHGFPGKRSHSSSHGNSLLWLKKNGADVQKSETERSSSSCSPHLITKKTRKEIKVLLNLGFFFFEICTTCPCTDKNNQSNLIMRIFITFNAKCSLLYIHKFIFF